MPTAQLHTDESCSHGIFFAFGPRPAECHFEISKHSDDGNPATFNLLFLSGFQPLVLFPSKSPLLKIKAGDVAKVGLSAAMMREASLPLWDPPPLLASTISVYKYKYTNTQIHKCK